MDPNAPAVPSATEQMPVPQPVPEPVVQASPPIQPLKKGHGTIVIVSIILVLVLIGGFLVYRFMQKSTTPVETKTPAQTVVQPVQSPLAQSTPVPETDLTLIDQSLSNLDKDFSSIDAGLNDKQGDLAEN